ncbi:hypothetical protein Tco_0589820 [Tanacetum coccineum]
MISFKFADIALPRRDQRHQYLRFEGLEYSNADITDFEERLGKIYHRGAHQVHVLDFGGLTDEMGKGLNSMMLMKHRDAQGLHTAEEIEFVGFGISSEGDFHGAPPSYTAIRDLMLRLCHRLIACNIVGRSQAPKKICEELDETWDWVALGPERQSDAVAGGPVNDEGSYTVPAPVQASQPPPEARPVRTST